MDFVRTLADPWLVAKIQRFFGVEYVKPGTCDQQTQTKRPSLDESDSDQTPSEEGNAASATSCKHLTHEKCLVCNQDKTGNCEINRTSISDIIPTSTRYRDSKCNDLEPNNNGININFTSVSKRHRENGMDEKALQRNHVEELSGSDIISCDTKTPVNYVNDNFSSAKGVLSSETSANIGKDQTIKIKYKILLYLANFGAFLGNEEFYLTVFPFILWNIDHLVIRHASAMWALTMYLGQATKDYLRWPRPQCPPVIRLETAYIQEFSMPSTHAMAGTAVPLCLAYLAIVRYQVPIPLAVVIAILWYSTTCFSRLYLGVHTVLDLIMGTIYATVIFFTFIGYMEDFDLYQQTHPFAQVMIGTTALLMCTFFYPNCDKTSSKGDAVQIVASYAGFSFGAWLAYQLDISHEPEILQPYEIQMPSLAWLGFSVLRLLSGVSVIAIFYVLVRKLTIQGFSYLYGLDVPDKTNPSVKTAYKYTTYFTLGGIISFFIPLMFEQLNIDRPLYFTEVL